MELPQKELKTTLIKTLIKVYKFTKKNNIAQQKAG